MVWRVELLDKGLTQAELAKRMHTTQSVIARLESGKQKPSLATLEKFAKATKCHLKVELVEENRFLQIRHAPTGLEAEPRATKS
ncbi:MAG: helix-turn-helix domain-containing protein [Polyangiaceae bacterium]